MDFSVLAGSTCLCIKRIKPTKENHKRNDEGSSFIFEIGLGRNERQKELQTMAECKFNSNKIV